MSQDLSITYHQIYYTSPIEYPHPFIGSAIRGALGWNLKKVVCINPTKKCEGCFAVDDCLYYDFFERKDPKYRFQYPLGGKIQFDLFIFEEYTGKLPYIVAALMGIGKTGIGRERQKSDQFEIWVNGELFVAPGREERLNTTPQIYTPPTQVPEKVRVKFITPFRVKEGGRLVREGLKLETLLRAINHRYRRLKGLPLEKLSWTPTYSNYREVGEGLKFVDYGRWSNRQKMRMKLGGLVGEIEIEGLDLNSYRLLKIGEVIGAGKQVTFGLGALKVEEVEGELESRQQGEVGTSAPSADWTSNREEVPEPLTTVPEKSQPQTSAPEKNQPLTSAPEGGGRGEEREIRPQEQEKGKSSPIQPTLWDLERGEVVEE